jgi:hypothetical protein
VREVQFRQQRGVALEEVGIALQVIRDPGLFQDASSSRPTGCLLMKPSMIFE